jgi:aspartyl/asparaginyl-tRNA synthetase
LVTKALFLFCGVSNVNLKKRDKITTILKDRANIKRIGCRYFAIKNSFTSINTVFLTKKSRFTDSKLVFINYSTTEDMVKLTPNLNPRGWDEMFSKDVRDSYRQVLQTLESLNLETLNKKTQSGF